LATGSKEEPIHLLRVFDWFFFATSSQSETLFTNLIVNFNLQFDIAIKIAIYIYSQQCCNIPRKRTSGLTVKLASKHAILIALII
jgi:hypothetical protein